MAYAGKILNLLRPSISGINTSPKSVFISKQFCTVYGRYEPLKIWRKRLGNILHNSSSRFQYELNVRRRYIRNLSLLGSRSCRNILGVSVIYGSICFRPQLSHALDGDEFLMDDYSRNLSGVPDLERDPLSLLQLFRKFLLPVILLITVLMNWDHPIVLATEIVLLLLSTKPNPLSVYLPVEQLCKELMRQRPHLYIFKNLYASKVDVQDLKLLCVAKIELGGQKFILLGILGTWWFLPSSEDVLSVLRSTFTRMRDKLLVLGQ